MRNYFWGFLFLSILTACHSGQEVLSVIHLDQVESGVLKLGDLAGELEYIPLETSDEVLIAGTPPIWVGEKYMVVVDFHAIYLFDKKGHFIRRLAQRGNGPGEYRIVFHFAVDEELNHFYYTDGLDTDHILILDLASGTPSGRISIAPLSTSSLSGLISCKDHSIVCSVREADHPVWQMAAYSPEGKRLYTVASDTAQAKNDMAILPYFCGEGERGVLCHDHQSDTLFLIKDGRKTPISLFHIEGSMLKNPEEGKVFFGEFAMKNHYGVNVYEMRKIQNEFVSGIMIKNPKKGADFYLVDLEDYSVKKADSFYFDPLDIQLKKFPELSVSGKYIFGSVTPLEILRICREKEENGESLSESLQQLKLQLKEDDNPVVFVGRVK